jgi:hypothetical protein
VLAPEKVDDFGTVQPKCVTSQPPGFVPVVDDAIMPQKAILPNDYSLVELRP